jgi:hypothetical protein
MAAYIQRIPFQPIEPCWPANPRFDDIAVGSNPAIWFETAVLEQLERAQSYSTCFTGLSPWLASLCEQTTASHEMHRRKTLLAARGGVNPTVPLCLQEEAPDHLNADIWRSGMVPGTCVIRNSRQSRRSNKLETHRETISRNALCPCGSGQKYKHCCGAYVS